MRVSEDKFKGCLLGVAVGDAMGYPAEGCTPDDIVKQFGGYISRFEQRADHPELKPGVVTDDTQLTLSVAESLAARGDVDPADLAKRFVKWHDKGVGVSETYTLAVTNIKNGKGGVNSDGNGAAMRAAPLGLLYYKDKRKLIEACRAASLVTHTDPRAVAGAVAVAGGVAACMALNGDFDPTRFLYELVRITDPVSREFANKLRKLPPLLEIDAISAMEKIRTGESVMESVPAAIYAFMRFHKSFKNTVLVAVNAGYDADTVASIAGGLCGALTGLSAIPEEWIEGLQPAAVKKLVSVAQKLHQMTK